MSTHTRMTELHDVEDHRLQVKMQASERNPTKKSGGSCTNGSGDIHTFVSSEKVWAPITFSRRSSLSILEQLESDAQDESETRSKGS